MWGILPKIREVDKWMDPALQTRVFEFYPGAGVDGSGKVDRCEGRALGEETRGFEAVSDAAKNNLSPLTVQRVLPSKHTHEGIEARLGLLRKAGVAVDLHWLRISIPAITVKTDDLLDALAGLKEEKDFLMPSHHPPFRNAPGKEESMHPAGEALLYRSSPSIFRLPPEEPPTDPKGLLMEIWY